MCARMCMCMCARMHVDPHIGQKRFPEAGVTADCELSFVDAVSRTLSSGRAAALTAESSPQLRESSLLVEDIIPALGAI